MSGIVGGESGVAMAELVRDPKSEKAAAIVTRDATWNGMLRTTCVATMLDAGHATNALPQRARANINCRIYPGVSLEEVRQTLVRVVDDQTVTVTTLESRGPPAVSPPLTREILDPIERISGEMYPGVPVVPILQAGATDGAFLTPRGIPTFGVMGMFVDPDLGNIHGLNERVRVASVYDGRDFLYKLVKVYSARPN
jgi:acetylornithine deacetylase/succinyl-diaminopimelate desuccinylase-like protein